MLKQIIDFNRDDHEHWRAKLACGHYLHMRHDPPLRYREWVLTEKGRTEKLGVEVDCKKCDAGEPVSER
jgi:hypothetical protein